MPWADWFVLFISIVVGIATASFANHLNDLMEEEVEND